MQYLYDDHFAELRFIILPRKCIHCGKMLFYTNAYINVYDGSAICTQCGKEKYLTEPPDPVKTYEEEKPRLAREIKELLEEKRRRQLQKNHK